MRLRLFRWRAIGVLLLLLLVLVGSWLIWGDHIVRTAVEDTASETLGTEVDVAWLSVRESESAVELRGLTIASPFNPNRNLLDAGHILVDLAPVPATEKKLVIDRLDLTGLRFGVERATPARPANRSGLAFRTLAETKRWAHQFNVPLLSLTPVDTLKALVLDPTQLVTVKAAAALVARADSVKTAFEQSIAALNPAPVLDSAQALVARLSATSPQKLGLQGTKDAVESGKRTLDQLHGLRQQLQTLEQSVGGSVAALGQGVKDLDQARLQDYAFARGLLQLPSFDAPNIGAALFGPPSVDVFQQALYYARLAEQYIPPGLKPWERSGPVRLRRAGTTVQFPKQQAWPTFLLRQGLLSFSLGPDTAKGAFRAQVAGLTTEPALYGKPATLLAEGRIAGSPPLGVQLSGLLDHVRKIPLDSVQATVEGVTLPTLELPGLPFGVEPGVGAIGFGFVLEGDRVSGRWELTAQQARWHADSARERRLSDVETALWRVISGLSDLQVRAELSGTVSAPKLSVHSNLDQAIADRLKAIAGEELAKGEAKARAAVDRLVDEKVGPVRAQVSALQTDVATRLGVDRTRLDTVQQQLETQLKRLVPGGLLKLPSF